jgi:acetyl esterase/lipase
MAQTVDVLARRGYVAIAPDYRLAPKHRFPACFEDCQSAVRWARANASKYRIDPKRIGVVGLSAGGHLACMLGMSDGSPDHSSAVQAVVSMAGPTDLASEKLWTEEVLKNNLVPLLGVTPKSNLELARRASPMHQKVHSPSPPFLLVHGTADRIVPVQQAEDLAGKLRQTAGSDARLLLLDGAGQTWSGQNLLQSIDTMLSFLDEILKK